MSRFPAPLAAPATAGLGLLPSSATPPAAPVASGTTAPTDRAPGTTAAPTRPSRRPPVRPTGASITVVAWEDPVVDELGHDPRSWYVETFWLGVLGPSTTWLVRRLVAGLELSPDGFALPLEETARRIGVGHKGGTHSPFLRAIDRCTTFHVARWSGTDTLAVRRRIPPLTLRQLERLSPSLQEQHRRYQESLVQRPAAEVLRERCRRLALTLAELGEDAEAVEQQLVRWRFHPALAVESAGWAAARLRHPSYQRPA